MQLREVLAGRLVDGVDLRVAAPDVERDRVSAARVDGGRAGRCAGAGGASPGARRMRPAAVVAVPDCRRRTRCTAEAERDGLEPRRGRHVSSSRLRRPRRLGCCNLKGTRLLCCRSSSVGSMTPVATGPGDRGPGGRRLHRRCVASRPWRADGRGCGTGARRPAAQAEGGGLRTPGPRGSRAAMRVISSSPPSMTWARTAASSSSGSRSLTASAIGACCATSVGASADEIWLVSTIRRDRACERVELAQQHLVRRTGRRRHDGTRRPRPRRSAGSPVGDRHAEDLERRLRPRAGWPGPSRWPRGRAATA